MEWSRRSYSRAHDSSVKTWACRVDCGVVSGQPPIERGFFREGEDGATVFFPWGLAHRGYRLTGDAARRSASRAVSLLVASVIAVGTWAAYALQAVIESEATSPADALRALAAPGAGLLLVLFCYAVWVWRFVERFPESDLTFSREERLREAAAQVEPRTVALIGLSVSAMSMLLVWLQPRVWWLGLLGVALGVGTVAWSAALRRAAAHPSDRSQSPGGG